MPFILIVFIRRMPYIYSMATTSKIILLFSLFILSTSHCPGGGILWEINSKENPKSKVYLLGSIHMASEDLYPMPKQVSTAFSDSDYLALELDISKIDPAEMKKKMMIGGGRNIDELLSFETIAKLDNEFLKFGLKKSVWEKFKPWAALLTLSQLKLNAEGFRPDLGIDFHYLMETIKDGQEVLELESFELQMDMFAHLDLFSEQYIEYSLQSLDSDIKMVSSLIQAWKTGDTLTFSKFIWNEKNEKQEENKKILKIMLDDRNVAMAQKIEEYLTSDKTYFVIVGTGHLLGKAGILQLLANKQKYQLIKK